METIMVAVVIACLFAWLIYYALRFKGDVKAGFRVFGAAFFFEATDRKYERYKTRRTDACRSVEPDKEGKFLR